MLGHVHVVSAMSPWGRFLVELKVTHYHKSEIKGAGNDLELAFVVPSSARKVSDV